MVTKHARYAKRGVKNKVNGSAFDQVERLLKDAAVTYQIHSHIPVSTIDDARQKVPHLTHNLLKTVVFQIKNNGWILAAVDSLARIHYKHLADAVGVNRTDLRSVPADLIQEVTGFELGGVGPFPIRDDLQVVIDENLRGVENVYCGSGRCDRTVEIALQDLIELGHATVYSISKSEE
ncbi:MAG: aminoacyl-tRNA deacylase [Pseudomonadales bacterium]